MLAKVVECEAVPGAQRAICVAALPNSHSSAHVAQTLQVDVVRQVVLPGERVRVVQKGA